MPVAVATHGYVRHHLAVVIAEFMSGMINSIPTEDDFVRADKIMVDLEKELTDDYGEKPVVCLHSDGEYKLFPSLRPKEAKNSGKGGD